MSDEATWIRRLDGGVDSGGRVRLAVKDCIDVASLPSTVGCEPIASRARPAAADADVVAAARKAGAAIVGKTNLTELCWSAAGTNSWSGTPVNPVDPGRLPGGSSSGSAVAVARGEADVALGTDTGGSVRIPAACCGVVGLKTTWGRVPVRGVYPLARSLDTVGPLGADVAAVELGMRLIDPAYGAVSGSERAVGRIRPAVDIDPAVDAAVDRALAAAGIATAEVTGLDLAASDAAAGVIIDAEGYQANEYLMPDLARLSRHVQRNMAHGAEITDAELADARRAQDSIRDWFTAMLSQHAFLAMPTLVAAAPLLGERGMPLTLLTVPANLAGLPALALPVPGGPAGLPTSLQLIGPPDSEAHLIALARVIEAALALPPRVRHAGLPERHDGSEADEVEGGFGLGEHGGRAVQGAGDQFADEAGAG
jgi:amidase